MAATHYGMVVFFADYPKAIRRGEIALKSNHLVKFRFDNNTGQFLGIVQASQRNKNYKVEIDLNDDGTVLAARCECARGNYKCHHMGAVLLHGIRNVSSTDSLCTWNRRATAEGMRTVADIFPPRTFNPLLRQPTQEDRNFFRAKLKLHNVVCGMRWLLAPEPPAASLPARTVDSVLGDETFVSSRNQLGCFLNKVQLNQEEVVAVERSTRGQRDNSLWGMFRKGRITASNFGPVIQNCNSSRQPSASLLKTMLGEYDLFGLKAIQYGIHHEQEAIKVYEDLTGSKVQESGLWLHHSGLLGASPDGIVDDDLLVEVKCPLKAKDASLEDVMAHKDFFISSMPDGSVCLAPNSQGRRYYHQVQGQLALANRQKCDFVVWTPREVKIIPIQRDPEWAINIGKMKDFYVPHIFPVLLEQ